MITMFEYTAEEIDYIYSAVEEAAANRMPVDENKMLKISTFIHPGDFYMSSYVSGGGLSFIFNGLRWVKDGIVYTCQLESVISKDHLFPAWKPAITNDDRTLASSGDLSMLKKEYRYIDTDMKWAMRGSHGS